jgi:hypothetical protein
MATRRVIPKFDSEADEARWWFEHADELMDDFDAAAADGTLGHGTVARRFGLTNIVELKSNDVDLARELAARHGVEYQTYVQNLVHDALVLAKAS